jgi:hypothetical protein
VLVPCFVDFGKVAVHERAGGVSGELIRDSHAFGRRLRGDERGTPQSRSGEAAALVCRDADGEGGVPCHDGLLEQRRGRLPDERIDAVALPSGELIHQPVVLPVEHAVADQTMLAGIHARQSTGERRSCGRRKHRIGDVLLAQPCGEMAGMPCVGTQLYRSESVDDDENDGTSRSERPISTSQRREQVARHPGQAPGRGGRGR